MPPCSHEPGATLAHTLGDEERKDPPRVLRPDREAGRETYSVGVALACASWFSRPDRCST